jgi:hypothetical protein
MAQVARGKAGDQGMLGVVGTVYVKAEAVVAEVPVDVSVRFTPEQYARYEGFLEKLRKQGCRESREELLLGGLEALVSTEREFPRGTGGRVARRSPARRSDGAPNGVVGRESSRAEDNGRPPRQVPQLAGTQVNAGSERSVEPASEDCSKPGGARFRSTGRPEFPRGNTSPYQVVVQVCEDCEKAEVVTSRGSKPITPGTLKAILCDAKVYRRGEKNRSTVPPSVKLEAMVRDRHQCQGVGCGSVRFLNVHHIVPREAGGPNTLENLITLCSGCHRTLHDLAEKHLNRRGLAEP